MVGVVGGAALEGEVEEAAAWGVEQAHKLETP